MDGNRFPPGVVELVTRERISIKMQSPALALARHGNSVQLEAQPQQMSNLPTEQAGFVQYTDLATSYCSGSLSGKLWPVGPSCAPRARGSTLRLVLPDPSWNVIGSAHYCVSHVQHCTLMWATSDANTSSLIASFPRQMPLIIEIPIISPMHHGRSFEGPDFWRRGTLSRLGEPRRRRRITLQNAQCVLRDSLGSSWRGRAEPALRE